MVRLKKVKTKDIMTPFSVMETASESLTLEEYFENTDQFTFSRIPIYDESIDDIKGIIIRSQLLMAASRDEWDVKISELSKDVLTISTNSSVDATLDLFLTNKQQIAIVADEFGGTSGIVTMEDVLETLLGEEIVDELDEVEDMRELARDQADYAESE